MPIITQRYLEELLEAEYARGYRDGLKSGKEVGRIAGLSEGLAADKRGVLMNGAGIFVFEDGVFRQLQDTEGGRPNE